jgi:pyruvate dehydrogenase E2 component (dihydrolipoamide acetyltransferase)
MSIVEVKVPDIGDFKEVEVIELMVKPGDTIKVDQSLVTVESDKASMEIPSSHAGVVKEIKIKVGDKVAEGSLVLTLEEAAGAAAAGRLPRHRHRHLLPHRRRLPLLLQLRLHRPLRPHRHRHRPPPRSRRSRPAGPVLRQRPRLAVGAQVRARTGRRPGKVKGSGPKGRITQQDVQGFVKGVMAAGPTAAPAAGGGAGMNLLPWPSLDFSKFGPTESQPLARIKKISGQNLHRNWVMIPHVTHFEEADVTDLEAFRVDSNAAYAKAKSATKLTMLAFVIKASVAALKKFPAFNASLDEPNGALILKQYYNIGFAADTPNGLVVPVIKDADKKSISQIATEMGELSAQARDGKLSPANMQGATFTISSLGGIGGTAFTPIINAPEVAILGLSKSAMKPVWDGSTFQPRLMLPLSLSYDHRVIDGAGAARFAAYLADVLADLRKTLL